MDKISNVEELGNNQEVAIKDQFPITNSKFLAMVNKK